LGRTNTASALGGHAPMVKFLKVGLIAHETRMVAANAVFVSAEQNLKTECGCRWILRWILRYNFKLYFGAF